jgi:hypothetical protein
MKAPNRNVERVFNPDRKDPHWGKRKLKRDEQRRPLTKAVFALPSGNRYCSLRTTLQANETNNSEKEAIYINLDADSLDLLKRDLDPASNDNDPMWLEKAA